MTARIPMTTKIVTRAPFMGAPMSSKIGTPQA